ncbi:MAG: hypothetical protein KIT16_15545 [Rhodospirillaceae bacterium]|nr:hypothetical protein [Rhodospirillaceae bacterium]
MRGGRWRASKRGRFGVFLGILGVGLAAIVAVPVYNRMTGTPGAYDTVDAARAENRPLFESLGLPPGAAPHAPYDEDVSIRSGRVSVVLNREFAATGAFAATIAWFAQRLSGQGWRPFDRDSWRDFVVRYCKPSWLLEIARRADFATERPPHHRFNLRLDWVRGMTESRCPKS